MITSRTVRRVIEKSGKSAMILNHDVYFIDMISDALIVFEEKPGKSDIGRDPYN